MRPSTDSTDLPRGSATEPPTRDAHRRGRRRRPAIAAALLTGCVVLAACGGTSEPPAQAGDWPLTVENCGAEVTFDKVPERVILLKSASVPFLAELGVLDHVVARAGVYPREYYDDETWAALEKIPVLTDEVDTSGHLQISREEVLAAKPDLVLGEIDNLDRRTLAASDIPLLEEPAFCSDLKDPGFDDINSQMRLYGQVFDRETEAATAVTEADQRVAQIEARVSGPARTAAVLYPTVGGGVTYAYGAYSMADPQLEAAGLTNVFGDTDKRVFEVTKEELIGRNPDVLILLYSEGDPAEVSKAVTSMTGTDQIGAVKTGTIITQPLNFSEPPTPLAIDGTERIVDRLYPR